LVELLRAQLEDVRADRDAWRDQARRSDYMASAALDRTRELESRIRELEAPQGEPESPLGRGSTESPTEELADAQKALEPSEMGTRRGYLLLAALVITVLQIMAFAWFQLPIFYYLLNVIASVVGLIQGFRSRLSFRSVWRRTVITSLLIMVLVIVVLFGQLANGGEFSGVDIDSFNEFMNVYLMSQASTLLVYGLPPALIYVSCVAFGNALQPRKIDERNDSVTASTDESWDARKQALLAFAGVIISAIIQAVAQLIN